MHSVDTRVDSMFTRTSLLKRFNELIDFGKALFDTWDGEIGALAAKTRWQTSCLHILDKTFGSENVYYKKFEKITTYADDSQLIWGIELMEGARDEIEKGLLYKIEHIIASDFFNSVIEQAEYLLKEKYKNVAAILGRVAIENTLKDIAKRENVAVPENTKLSKLNQLLRKENVYPLHMWRSIQAQIDLGNDAAHGQFDKYDEKAVTNMLIWIRETLLNL